MILSTLPGRLAALGGWRRALFLTLLGALLAAALPPVYILPAAAMALTGLAWCLDGAARIRRSFLDGWFFGFGFAVAGLSWIANALLVDAGRTGWMFPFALVLIGAGFGLFQGLATMLAGRVPAGVARVLALAVAWLVIEWLKTWFLTGFPWNAVGTAFALSDALIQPAAWGGPWLLSALVLAMSLLPAFGAHDGMIRPRRLAMAMAGSAALVALLWGVGTWRLDTHPERDTDVVVRLVQPSIKQSEKWQSTLFESHFATQIALTLLQPASESPDVVIWPEAAVPYTLLRQPETLNELAAAAPADGLLLVGAVRADHDGEGRLRPFNSMLAIERDGLLALYDKAHLVPFGEYMPLRDILPLEKLTTGGVDFAAGPGPQVLNLGNLPPFGPLICYEIIFPGEVVADDARPDWLVNLTNDGWYGRSTGPYQHFEAARMRAVEQGLPVVRVANNGISGVIDPLGRVTASLPLDHRGVLDTALPAPLDEPTFYARVGDMSLPVVLLPLILGLAWTLLRCRRVGDGLTSSATGRR